MEKNLDGAWRQGVITGVISGKQWFTWVMYKLEQAGIPKSDIVLGFQVPEVRPYTEYAVA
jgi:hypothetical protein